MRVQLCWSSSIVANISNHFFLSSNLLFCDFNDEMGGHLRLWPYGSSCACVLASVQIKTHPLLSLLRINEHLWLKLVPSLLEDSFENFEFFYFQVHKIVWHLSWRRSLKDFNYQVSWNVCLSDHFWRVAIKNTQKVTTLFSSFYLVLGQLSLKLQVFRLGPILENCLSDHFWQVVENTQEVGNFFSVFSLVLGQLSLKLQVFGLGPTHENYLSRTTFSKLLKHAQTFINMFSSFSLVLGQ